ncbi:uncharacterized protein [Littorina saxatilis]|uniref:Uncharacterized protein n=1 Tax=Littorina saxatilis TaxID=31220 RepID=A0AAN9BGL5_9CAEN
MAEGGTDSSLLRNNLVGNQKEKTMGEKVVNQSTGYPEIPYTPSHQSLPSTSRNNVLAHLQYSPLHHYSQQSETELKAPLNAPPLLTPLTSLEQVADNQQQAGSPPQSSHGPPSEAAQASSHAESSDNSNSITSNIAHGDQDGGAGSSFTSSYVRCAASSSSTQGAISTSTFEGTPTNLQNNSTKLEGTPTNLHNTPTKLHNTPTKLEGTPPNLQNYPDKANDLSADISRPATQVQQPGFFHGATQSACYQGMPSGVMSSPGGFLPNMMYYPLQVSYTQGGQPSVMPMMAPMFGSVGNPPFFPSGGAMSYPMAHPLMMPNISCPPNPGQAASPLSAPLSGGTSQPTLDSRNIPANLQGPSPPSSGDNNSSGTYPSYSINPTNGTRLIRLRKPILEWLRRKLDQGCLKNWEAVADARGMKYEDIRAHLTDCRHNRESPFMKLLETEEFHAYTVGEFLEDVKSIKRKDILMDFDSVVRNNKG